MSGYFYNIADKHTIIYVFFDDKMASFAVEVCGGEIVQATAAGNSNLTVKQQKALDEWFKVTYVKRREEAEQGLENQRGGDGGVLHGEGVA